MESNTKNNVKRNIINTKKPKLKENEKKKQSKYYLQN